MEFLYKMQAQNMRPLTSSSEEKKPLVNLILLYRYIFYNVKTRLRKFYACVYFKNKIFITYFTSIYFI